MSLSGRNFFGQKSGEVGQESPESNPRNRQSESESGALKIAQRGE